MSGKLEGKVALVTGASRGIGHAVARALANEGAHVIALARPRSTAELEKLDDLIQRDGGKATLVPLDLVDYDSIDRMGAALYERFGKLDILVANAGSLTVLSPLTHIEPKDFQNSLDTNLTANWRLIRSLDPLLRAAPAARAVFVSSSVATKVVPFWGAYSVAKAGLEMLVKTYAAERAGGTMRINLINPGATRTAMRAKAAPGEDPMTLPHPEELAPLFLEMCGADYDRNGDVVNFRDWAAERGLSW